MFRIILATLFTVFLVTNLLSKDLTIDSYHRKLSSNIVTVKGYFCATEKSAKEYALLRAGGINEIMSAEYVNKRAKAAVCAPYISVDAIPGKSRATFDKGVLFTIQEFLFLPEKVVMYQSTTSGSLLTNDDKDI